jgi:hypothetical protein
MENSEMMIVTLRRQKYLLDELVSELELREVISAEDYSYCESRTDEMIRELKNVRRFAIDEMIKGAPWDPQVTLR